MRYIGDDEICFWVDFFKNRDINFNLDYFGKVDYVIVCWCCDGFDCVL